MPTSRLSAGRFAGGSGAGRGTRRAETTALPHPDPPRLIKDGSPRLGVTLRQPAHLSVLFGDELGACCSNHLASSGQLFESRGALRLTAEKQGCFGGASLRESPTVPGNPLSKGCWVIASPEVGGEIVVFARPRRPPLGAFPWAQCPTARASISTVSEVVRSRLRWTSATCWRLDVCPANAVSGCSS